MLLTFLKFTLFDVLTFLLADPAGTEAPGNLHNSLDPPERAETDSTESIAKCSERDQNDNISSSQQVILSTTARTVENSTGNCPVSV